MSIITEEGFFHSIAPAVINLVQNTSKKMTIVENKHFIGDYSTQVDVDTENLIVTALNTYFPDDTILAEESYSSTEIPSSRIWLIDPICGTNNLGKGIRNFCTNIALADGGKVIASCVIDLSQNEYLWSVGHNKVYINSEPYIPPSPSLGQKIDIDFGSLKSVDEKMRAKHNKFLRELVLLAKYDIISLNTSLGFAYTAIGKTDGFVNVDNNPWDIAAASFLIEQAGSVITGLDGSPWTIATRGAIGGRTPAIHRELLELFSGS